MFEKDKRTAFHDKHGDVVGWDARTGKDIKVERCPSCNAVLEHKQWKGIAPAPHCPNHGFIYNEREAYQLAKDYDGKSCFGQIINIDLKICQVCKKQKACGAKLMETEGYEGE